MKRKKGYETPLIEKFRVELEEGVGASSIMDQADSKVEASKHDTGFDETYTTGDYGFHDIAWE